MENINTKNLPTRFVHMIPSIDDQKESHMKILFHLMNAYNLFREEEESILSEPCAGCEKSLRDIQSNIHNLAFMIDEVVPGTLPDEIALEVNALQIQLDAHKLKCENLEKKIAELSGE